MNATSTPAFPWDAAGRVPCVLEKEIGVYAAITFSPRPVFIPQALCALHDELRVGSVSQVLDGGVLQRVESCLAVVEPAQHTEWNRQDHVIGGYVAYAMGREEGESKCAIALLRDGLHPPFGLDTLLGKRLGNSEGDLVVAAEHVESLV